MKRLLIVLNTLLLLCVPMVLEAQIYKVTGKVTERGNLPIPGAVVTLINAKDTTQRTNVLTDANGAFTVMANPISYKLKVSILGLEDVTKKITVTERVQDVGTILMTKKVQQLDEITIEGQKTPVVQKGDTTEMSAAAFKVNPDANVQDLVKKMPGVTIEDGVVKFQNEQVKRVLLDGKNYAGEDAVQALQSLPADMVDKIQFHNKLSDQAEMTGFDDGNSERVLNIKTRSDRRLGQNGKFMVGHDFVDKYSASAQLNVMREKNRFFFNGASNNIGQQSFSTRDMLGAMGGNSGRGGNGGFVSNQGGKNTTSHNGSFNYQGQLGKKVEVAGGYSFKWQNSESDSWSNTTYLDWDAISRPQYGKSKGTSETKNVTHDFDMRLTYNIDSFNTLIIAPRYSSQNNRSQSENSNISFNDALASLTNNIPTDFPDTVSSTKSNSTTPREGYNLSNNLTFRHQFAKKGRTLSLGLNTSMNTNDQTGANYSKITRNDTVYFRPTPNRYDSTFTTDLSNISNTYSESLSSNLSFTEAVGTKGSMQFSYNNSFQNSSADLKAMDNITQQLRKERSNEYKNSYNRHSIGVTYGFRLGGATAQPAANTAAAQPKPATAADTAKGSKPTTTPDASQTALQTEAQTEMSRAAFREMAASMASGMGGMGGGFGGGMGMGRMDRNQAQSSQANFNLGLEYQYAELIGHRVYPNKSRVSRTFKNLLPNMMINYKISSKSNIRATYRTSTNAPSVDQMQDVITKRSEFSYSVGNKNLEHTYQHSGDINYRFSNPQTFISYNIQLSGGLTMDPIGTANYRVKTLNGLLLSTNDTAILVPKSGSYSKPWNYKQGSWNAAIGGGYGFKLNPIKCNINYTGSVRLSTSPGSQSIDMDSISTNNESYNFTNRLVISSNVSENVDFTFNYTNNYQLAHLTYKGNETVLSANKLITRKTETMSHNFGFTSTFNLFDKRLVLSNTLSQSFNHGYGKGYNVNPLVWNSIVGVKLLKSRMLMVSASANDLLAKNQNIRHTVSPTSITDSNSSIIRRYFLFSVTYTLRQYIAGGSSSGYGGFGGGGRGGGGGGFGGGRGGF